MPGTLSNADINFPTFEGSTEKQLKDVESYLYMLLENLRYSLANIGTENMNSDELDKIIKMSAKQIDLTGYVTFNALEEEGQTIINGSNITTGTISADRLYLTGAIEWSDLTSAAQQRVDAGKGDDNPSYIHSTYIGATEIRSPTIKATNFSVYPASGDTEGSYNLYTNGHNYPMLTISHRWYDSPTVTFSSPSSANATWNFPETRIYGGIVLEEGKTYGTTAQRDALSASDGQIFFVV